MKKHFAVVLIATLGALSALNAQDYEADFQQVKQQFEERISTTQGNLKTYMDAYPYTPYADETRVMQGVLYVEKEKYKQADKAFDKVNPKYLSRQSEPMFYFYQGYSFVRQKKYNKALRCMLHLKNKQNAYTTQAKYYAGYCYYSMGDYPHAMAEFLSVEQSGAFRKVVPYYIVQMYYAQRQYDKVYERAERLLTDYPDNENNDELHRILGEIYYQDSVYTDAIRHLEAYRVARQKQKKELLRNDMYLLGMANYKTGNYQEAIDNLRQVKQKQDSISENTCLHLGHSYLRIGDLEKAKLSYSAAMQFRLNDRLREEAMYNYVQITYLQGSALGESIKAFQDFLREYPNTAYANKVYALMADMYVSSRNYKAALEALSGVSNPNAKMIETMQYLRYQIGVDAFLQEKMQDAVQWMSQVIQNAPKPSTFKTEAYYVRAEAQYRLTQYDACLQDLQTYDNQPNVSESENHTASLYLRGYAYFNRKKLAEAEQVFRRYIAAADKSDATYSDAMNRIGDCLFNTRKFADACAMYQQVAKTGSTGADYALFQCGYAQGLQHKYNDKVQTMETLVRDYPHSDYAANALYEAARAQLQMEHNTEAIDAYTRLLGQYPHSNKAPKASLESGMTYRTLKQYNKAIAAFKTTIERYVGSEEAYSALEGLEQVYVETNNVDEYLAYTKSLNKMNMKSVSKEDSLVYVTAELQYMLGNSAQAAAGMVTYLTRFCPDGRYCLKAQYYAANSYYQLKQFDQAIDQYSALAEMSGNPYMEEACMRVAELSYDKQEYHTALYYFRKMQQVASSSKMLHTAQLGVLRCSFYLGDDATTIEVASDLLDQTNLPDDIRKEALYNRAKAYWKGGQYGLSIADLTPLAKEVRTANGAEAKYLLADCYFHLGAMDTAEQEIMSFTQMQTSQQYWLARSLILLSDINVQRGDLFQAKQYLLALQSNYQRQDDIQTMVQEHLNALVQAEETTTEQEDEL